MTPTLNQNASLPVFELMKDLHILITRSLFARMAELADALASGASGRKVVGVQVPVRAQEKPRVYGAFSFSSFFMISYTLR
jgi:hypothetical protein